MGLAYMVGGPVADVTLAASSVETTIPPLADGERPRWIVCQTLGTVIAYIKTGITGDSIGLFGGLLVQRNSGDVVLKIPPGHTKLYSRSTGAGTMIVTPLAERPGDRSHR